MRTTVAWVSLLMCACGSSHALDDASADLDAGRDALTVDAATRDAGPGDAGLDAESADASFVDAARADAMLDVDGGADPDAGMTCGAASCGTRSCGRSDCGASCGECDSGYYCNASGTCVDRAAMPPPGSACFDAFGESVVEGGHGFRVCPTDPMLLQRCVCSGGGASSWIGCDPCVDVVLDGARGDRCATDAQCADPVPCHPTIRLCGERCDRGLPVTCPADTQCGIPGDIAGACLPACDTCGTGCSDRSTCRRAESGNVCVPSGYVWSTGC